MVTEFVVFGFTSSVGLVALLDSGFDALSFSNSLELLAVVVNDEELSPTALLKEKVPLSFDIEGSFSDEVS